MYTIKEIGNKLFFHLLFDPETIEECEHVLIVFGIFFHANIFTDSFQEWGQRFKYFHSMGQILDNFLMDFFVFVFAFNFKILENDILLQSLQREEVESFNEKQKSLLVYCSVFVDYHYFFYYLSASARLHWENVEKVYEVFENYWLMILTQNFH